MKCLQLNSSPSVAAAETISYEFTASKGINPINHKQTSGGVFTIPQSDDDWWMCDIYCK